MEKRTAAGLLQAVGLADGGVEVNGERPLSRSRPHPPGPLKSLAADHVQLQGMAPSKGAQEGAQGGGGSYLVAQYRGALA